jgi:hypothetical protein
MEQATIKIVIYWMKSTKPSWSLYLINIFVSTRIVPTDTFIEVYSLLPFEIVIRLPSVSYLLDLMSFVRCPESDLRQFVSSSRICHKGTACPKLTWWRCTRWIKILFIHRLWTDLAPSRRNITNRDRPWFNYRKSYPQLSETDQDFMLSILYWKTKSLTQSIISLVYLTHFSIDAEAKEGQQLERWLSIRIIFAHI